MYSLISCLYCPYSLPRASPLSPCQEALVSLTSTQVSPSLLSALLALDPQLSPEKQSSHSDSISPVPLLQDSRDPSVHQERERPVWNYKSHRWLGGYFCYTAGHSEVLRGSSEGQVTGGSEGIEEKPGCRPDTPASGPPSMSLS